MEEVAVEWVRLHPEEVSWILLVCATLVVIGNVCRATQKLALTRGWRLSPRVKIALDVGATVGNVVLGAGTLLRSFVRGDPEKDSSPPSTRV